MRGKRVGGLVVAACLALPAMAEASTLTATLEFSSRPPSEGYAMYYGYDAAAGERNDLTITQLPQAALLRTAFADRGALISGPSPVLLGPLPGVPVGLAPVTTCVPGLLLVACVSLIKDAYVYVTLADGNDRARVEGSGGAFIDGGSGNDTLGGGPGGESMIGGTGADTLLGGAGFDGAYYLSSTGPLAVTLDGVANDGAPGEGDNVGADIEYFSLGSGNATVIGNDRAQTVQDGGGSDHIEMRGGNDVVVLESGTDVVDLGDGDDTIYLERDNVADVISCGPGNDTVSIGISDPLDTISPDCEVVS
jgi:Ca2+-binding RTX toxin-like protein